MTQYVTTPEEIEAEIRALPISFDPIADPEVEKMSIHDRESMEELFYTAQAGTKASIRALKHLSRKYPRVPGLKNHLSVAYNAAGKYLLADQVTEQILEKHPDYLFGRINLAAQYLKEEESVERIPELLGAALRLVDLKEGCEVYHVSEIRGFYQVVALYHLRKGSVEMARTIHKVLVDLIGDDDPALEHLDYMIKREALTSFQDRIAADEAKEIRVTSEDPEMASQPELLPPGFQNAETQLLYEYGLDFPTDELNLLLKVPRELIVPDLEAALHDSIVRGVLYREERIDYEVEEWWFPLHALLHLGERRATESLPTVLAVFSQSEDTLDWWFGDILETFLWQPVYQLIEGDPGAVMSWMLSPGISARARDVVGKAVSQIALHQPERREEVLLWFQEVLEFLRESPPEDNVLDTRLVTGLVCSLCDIRAIELRDLIRSLYEKGYLSEVTLGDWDEIEEFLTEAQQVRDLRPIFSLPQMYRELRRNFGGDTEETRSLAGVSSHLGGGGAECEMEEEISSVSRLPSQTSRSPTRRENPKVGRNEPCPCGSGKKYKKCCG